ncbi:E3 ubiquitin-protein ligase SHPRH [[Emmonsia] crescens]|uniref:E3 ubiquitin-protein ligase SHPRH n=1 Tax=[Emmonsia] crescens TaxID=73230 RepID=A0A2B7ZD65_9EURO|nr:E3 ubiquitin-protein ligase SHPRH [Emmonsia crescens]
MNGNLSLARDVKGAKQHGPENQLLMEPLIPKTRSRRSALAICIFTMFLTFLYVFAISPDSAILKGKIFQSNSTQLQVFQVYKPVPSEPPHKVPGDGCNTELLLMRHEFGFSYGHPFVGNYAPPPCAFDTVIMNLTVTSKGRQFDRLALMFLGDTEVFRTSTAEPTFNGIIWTYVKDMSLYKALWMEPQKLIFDLGNLIDDTYTGPFDVTLTVMFSLRRHEIRTADVILPISAQRSAVDSPSGFNIPEEKATVTHIIPSDASRAVVSISACGQSTEEFWYSNVLSSDIDTFNETTGLLYGYSPFREIQLYIDGQMAGVVWPFPIIFTGGIAPGFWRPIVGIDAFDLREPEIDITPFLPVLADGQAHSFGINVVGLGDVKDGIAEISETVGSYWVVTGKIFIYLGGEAAVNTTEIQHSDLPPMVSTKFKSDITHGWQQNPDTGVNETLSYTVQISRSLTAKSPSSHWTQSLTFSNSASFSDQGRAQLIKQVTDSTSKSLDFMDEKDIVVSKTASSYPLEVYSVYQSNSSGLEIKASLSRGLQFSYKSDVSYHSPYTLTTGPCQYDATQFGEATYRSTPGRSRSTGDTTEVFKESSAGATYDVRVRAVDGAVVEGHGQSPAFNQSPYQEVPLGRDGIRAILGRGPGRSKP